MTKLDEIITAEAKKFSAPLTPEGLNLLIHNVALEFAKHVLEEAAENANVRKDTFVLGQGKTEIQPMFNYSNGTSHYIDKQSITDTLNKYL